MAKVKSIKFSSSEKKPRSFRAPDDFWNEVKDAAKKGGMDTTGFIIWVLSEYLKKRSKTIPKSIQVHF